MAGKKLSRTALKIKADTLFSKIVRLVGRCERCSGITALQCAHIISRRYLCTRWDLGNAVCLCARCHMYMTHRPLEWEEWVIARIGAQRYENLKRKALSICKPDYPAILDSLRTSSV